MDEPCEFCDEWSPESSTELRNEDIAYHFDEIADAYNAMGSQDNQIQFKERAFRTFGRTLRKHHVDLVYSWQVDELRHTKRNGATEKINILV